LTRLRSDKQPATQKAGKHRNFAAASLPNGAADKFLFLLNFISLNIETYCLSIMGRRCVFELTLLRPAGYEGQAKKR